MEFGSSHFFFLDFFFRDGKRKHDGLEDEDRIIEDDDEMDEGELLYIFSYQNLTSLCYFLKKTSHIDQMLF